MQKVFSHHNPQNKIASTDKCQNYAAIYGTDHQKSDGGGGGGRGIFSLHDFLFSPTAYEGIFFAGETCKFQVPFRIRYMK